MAVVVGVRGGSSPANKVVICATVVCAAESLACVRLSNLCRVLTKQREVGLLTERKVYLVWRMEAMVCTMSSVFIFMFEPCLCPPPLIHSLDVPCL